LCIKPARGANVTDDPYDRDAYVRDLIAHRVPGIAAADVDALASPLPLDEIIAFCDAVAERLTRIEIRFAVEPAKRVA
jgi:hypothetical protein